MRAKLAVLVVVTLALLYPPRVARANGRFPKAQVIRVVPGSDGKTIFLRATFGVIVSRDGGRTWGWECEQRMGFSSTWDPPIAATRDGALWVGLPDGLRATGDGCAMQSVAALEGRTVLDLTVDTAGDRVYVLAASPAEGTHVWVGRSGAAPSFTRLGEGVRGFRFDTVEVAPSNAKRMYFTATPDLASAGAGEDAAAARRAHFFRSDDGGATIVESPAAFPGDGRLFVSAVDPKDADRVLVRALAETGSDVLLSTDGGRSFKSVLHMPGAMYGFTRTRDGAVYYAGGGDAKDGLWRSRDRGATWEPAARTPVFCLDAEGPALLVGSNPFVPNGYAIAESRDDGATLRPLATFAGVTGPVACPSDPACDPTWPATHALITTGSAPEAAPGGPDAGSPAAIDAGAASPAAPRPASRCGCAIVGARGAPRAALALLAMALGLAVARSHPGSRRPQRRR